MKLKRIASMLLVLCLAISLLPPVQAHAATSGYYTYEVYDGKASITDCKTSTSVKITIPSTLGGNPVTSIRSYAFQDCTGITAVTIPDGVTSVGEEAFSGCTALTKVSCCGTEEQWNSISIGSYNTYLTSVRRQYHDYQAATCTASKTCSACGLTEGDTLGHSWMDATCTTPQDLFRLR